MADEKRRSQQQRQSSAPPRLVSGTVVAEDNALATQTRGEIEMMMEFGRRYPRSIEAFRVDLRTMVLKDQDTADECTYALPRDGKMIPGPSIRFAEMVMYCWGHMMAFAMPVSEDGKTITCRGIAWDLQRNTRMGGDTKRRILTREGDRYSDDMVIVTMNAGNSIARRNAILQAVPSCEWKPIWEEAQVVALGKQETIATLRANICDALQKIGAKLPLVWKTFGVQGPADLNLTQIATLRGYYRSIRDGQLTVEDAFPDDQAPSLSGELVDAQMQRLADENMGLAADLEQEFKRIQFNQAQRLQKLTAFNGRWSELLVDLRGTAAPDAPIDLNARPPEQKSKPVEKPVEPETRPAPVDTKPPVDDTKAAAAETAQVQQRIEQLTPKPAADAKPASKIEEARRRLNMKPGQTF